MAQLEEKATQVPRPPVEVVQRVLEFNWIHEHAAATTDQGAWWRSNVRNYNCMHDGQPFDGPVFWIPFKYETRGDRKYFTVRFPCCSLGCAFQHLRESKFGTPKIQTLFSLMCITVYGVNSVTPAPARARLRCFGGDLSLTEMRTKSPQRIRTELTSVGELPFLFDRMLVLETFAEDHPEYERITEVQEYAEAVRQKRREEIQSQEREMMLKRQNDEKVQDEESRPVPQLASVGADQSSSLLTYFGTGASEPPGVSHSTAQTDPASSRASSRRSLKRKEAEPPADLAGPSGP